jgi:hypothetical protein
MAATYCSTCGHNVRDWSAHVRSREHLRKLYPAGSPKSSRANARREKTRHARHTLTKKWEDRMWEEEAKRDRADRRAAQGPRHWYGPWTPPGVSAFMGGHPGRALKKVHRKLRHHVRRLVRGTDEE